MSKSLDELMADYDAERIAEIERDEARRSTPAAKALAAYRAERAEKAILTERQAPCLAAIRAGQGAFSFWESKGLWRGWRRSRNTGGAVSRMLEGMIEEGLITDRRELTPGGLARLEAWEAKHGRIGGAA